MKYQYSVKEAENQTEINIELKRLIHNFLDLFTSQLFTFCFKLVLISAIDFSANIAFP